MSREALHPRNPELVGLAQGAGDGARQAALFAARTALARNEVSHPLVVEALRALDAGDLQGVSGVRGELEALLTELDEEYWNRSSAPGSQDAEVEVAFTRARAVNALVSALDANPTEAALSAIYEAHASLPDQEIEGFLDTVKDLLRTLRVGP